MLLSACDYISIEMASATASPNTSYSPSLSSFALNVRSITPLGPRRLLGTLPSTPVPIHHYTVESIPSAQIHNSAYAASASKQAYHPIPFHPPAGTWQSCIAHRRG